MQVAKQQPNSQVVDSNLIPMGKVVNAFGIKGWVKIKTSTHQHDSLSHYKKLYVFINNEWILHDVEQSFVQNEVFHAKLDNVTDRDGAMMLKGAIVAVPRGEFPAVENDEYYWVDLIGLSVYNSNKEYLGIVDSLMETGANSVLVVKDNAEQFLIPFVATYISDVDLREKQITVFWERDY